MPTPSDLATSRMHRKPYVGTDIHEDPQLTETYRYQAVKHAIAEMRKRFVEPLTLQELSRITHLSPFYFNRVFRSVTGVSPSVFLAAIRLERAKKLLLHTERSVTEICFDVGYNSMGTFAYRFNMFVGMAPGRFRLFATQTQMRIKQEPLLSLVDAINQEMAALPGIHGSLLMMDSQLKQFKGLIFIGVFRDPLPQGKPVSCTLLTRPMAFHLPPVPDGKYYLFASVMDYTQNLFTLLDTDTYLHGGLGRYPLIVREGHLSGQTTMQLTGATWSDPPLLIALPWLLLSRFPEAAGVAVP